mmetsp:Transcript_22373/g.56977  ORF Transcript_22373/g.56977 Transcript_22373/m.56977 type:complete len:352 (+) Transcript_22373:460-1515(+)
MPFFELSSIASSPEASKLGSSLGAPSSPTWPSPPFPPSFPPPLPLPLPLPSPLPPSPPLPNSAAKSSAKLAPSDFRGSSRLRERPPTPRGTAGAGAAGSSSSSGAARRGERERSFLAFFSFLAFSFFSFLSFFFFLSASVAFWTKGMPWTDCITPTPGAPAMKGRPTFCCMPGANCMKPPLPARKAPPPIICIGATPPRRASCCGAGCRAGLILEVACFTAGAGRAAAAGIVPLSHTAKCFLSTRSMSKWCSSCLRFTPGMIFTTSWFVIRPPSHSRRPSARISNCSWLNSSTGIISTPWDTTPGRRTSHWPCSPMRLSSKWPRPSSCTRLRPGKTCVMWPSGSAPPCVCR